MRGGCHSFFSSLSDISPFSPSTISLGHLPRPSPSVISLSHRPVPVSSLPRSSPSVIAQSLSHPSLSHLPQSSPSPCLVSSLPRSSPSVIAQSLSRLSLSHLPQSSPSPCPIPLSVISLSHRPVPVPSLSQSSPVLAPSSPSTRWEDGGDGERTGREKMNVRRRPNQEHEPSRIVRGERDGRHLLSLPSHPQSSRWHQTRGPPVGLGSHGPHSTGQRDPGRCERDGTQCDRVHHISQADRERA
jgi:hypothetical protein